MLFNCLYNYKMRKVIANNDKFSRLQYTYVCAKYSSNVDKNGNKSEYTKFSILLTIFGLLLNFAFGIIIVL